MGRGSDGNRWIEGISTIERAEYDANQHRTSVFIVLENRSSAILVAVGGCKETFWRIVANVTYTERETENLWSDTLYLLKCWLKRCSGRMWSAMCCADFG